VVEQWFCKPSAVCSNQIGGSEFFKNLIMSLISQKDRDLAIEALDFYLFNKKFDLTAEKKQELNALLNWIKLENYKKS
jgi:hypothetical protein